MIRLLSLLLLTLSAGEPTPAELPIADLRPVRLWSEDRGQLVARWERHDAFAIAGHAWSIEEDGRAGEYEISRPAGYFNGRVTLAIAPGRIHLSGWRYTEQRWRVSAFDLRQTPGRTTASWTIRTPAGQPDITIDVEDRTTADLVRHCPAAAGLLNLLLAEVGSPPYRPGAFLEAVAAGETPDPVVAAKVMRAIERLDSPSGRERVAGEDDIDRLGWPGALCLRTWPQRDLTIQQRLAVQSILAGWPGEK